VSGTTALAAAGKPPAKDRRSATEALDGPRVIGWDNDLVDGVMEVFLQWLDSADSMLVRGVAHPGEGRAV